MKRFFEWGAEYFVECLVLIAAIAILLAALLGEGPRGFSAACKEAGGVPVHDGRQMVCIK
ncbi:hypothetical protein SAMN05216359_105289 [Roseateles sp. YR242]|uniref:hypothetical protein n=1 Tax=Roseateles sp. YR242 TaxID=1855305 RepID=UPI0008AB573D|nr:hypothetical protein [Roseateles sp. YR242]SEL12615.1 hypothetical protein SAMN05216359_105289 [Roseateles sp. YR242]